MFFKKKAQQTPEISPADAKPADSAPVDTRAPIEVLSEKFNQKVKYHTDRQTEAEYCDGISAGRANRTFTEIYTAASELAVICQAQEREIQALKARLDALENPRPIRLDKNPPQ